MGDESFKKAQIDMRKWLWSPVALFLGIILFILSGILKNAGFDTAYIFTLILGIWSVLGTYLMIKYW